MKKVQGLLLSLAIAAGLTFVAANMPVKSAQVSNKMTVEKPKLAGWLSIVLHKADPKIPGKFRSYFFAPKKNLIVDAGETALRDCFIATSCTSAQNFKFHGLGTGTTAAAETQTTLVTELTTQYNPDNTRATGSQTNNGPNVYRTVGTNTVDASAAVTEWGLFTATTAGTMWSRVVFSAINLSASDSLQTTYDLTIE